MTKANVLRDPLVVIGMLERGGAQEKLEKAITTALSELYDMAGPKNKAKGTVTLQLTFEVQGPSCGVSYTVEAKTPKQKSSTQMFFVTPNGELTQDHPEQIHMFPREAEPRSA
jgi:hypothetical protein